MILLVVGVAAVIAVIFIAVFLSIRLGRSDDHEEPEATLGGHDRRRPDQDHWPDEDASGGYPHRRDEHPHERDERRISPARRPEGRDPRPSGREPGSAYGDRRAREHDRRQATRIPGYPTRMDGYEGDYGERGGSRPGYDERAVRRPGSGTGPHPAVKAGAPGPGPAGRLAAGRRARYDPHRPPRDGDFPSGDFPSMDPRGGQPSADFPPDERAEADFRSGDGRRRPDAQRPDHGRTDPRGKPAKAASHPTPGPAKGRLRQRAKADDEWPSTGPSTEWDKLSDEQYWAELSADKPLASMARRKPESRAKAAPRGPASAKPASSAPPGADSRLPRRPPAAGRPGPPSRPVNAGRAAHESRPLPDSHAMPGSRALPDGRHLHDSGPMPASRALPDSRLAPDVRSASAVQPGRMPATQAAGASADLPPAVYAAPVPTSRATPATGDHGVRSPASRLPGHDLPVRNKRGSPLEEVAERLPVRSRQQLGVPTAHSLLDPAGAHGSIPAGIRSASEHGLSALSDLARTPASPPPGALDDDPLTSPSFAAVPGTDSRSYGKARKHAAPAHASPPAAEFDRENGYRGHHSGSHHVGAYLAADHLGADYEQLPGPASRTPVPSAGERYAAPGEQHSASAYSNPYGGPVSSAVGTMQPRLGGGQAAAGYSGDGSGEASGYVQPAYQPPATEHYAGWSAGPFPPQPLGAPLQELDGADHAGYLDGYSAQLGYGDSPLAGRPGPGGYASSTGHAPGYDRRHVTDPYRAGGYDGYPAQG